MFKSLITTTSVLLIVTSLSSCKKDFTCTCKDGNIETTVEYSATTEKTAKEACSLKDADFRYTYPNGKCRIND